MFIVGGLIGTMLFWFVVIGMAEARPLDDVIREARGENDER